MQLRTRSKVAVIAARGLGDGLLSLILSNNLMRSGHVVTTYSTILCQMRDWFPGHMIASFNEIDFSTTDHVIAADHSLIRKSNEKTLILFEREFDKSKSMVENLVIAAAKLGLEATAETGVMIPPKLEHRRYAKRVILHPMSSAVHKNWHPEGFRALSKRLLLLGFDPVLCVGPEEKECWPEARTFPTISDLAAFIYESGVVIGNDSGLGHLASLLDIPTLSLFARKSYSRLWRPAWNRGIVVTPNIPLIGASMKQRYWKNFLTVSQVLKNFKHLIKKS